MNKSELIDKIAAGAGLTKDESKKALDAAVAAVKEALVSGDKELLLVLEHSLSMSVVSTRVSTPLPKRRS